MFGTTRKMGRGIYVFIATLIITLYSVRAESLSGLQIPEVERKTLLNGMQFVFFDGSSERVPFLLMIRNGAAFDPTGKWGATYLLARLMIDSLQNGPWKTELSAKKIEYDYEVDWDALYFFGMAPPDELEFALTSLADAIIEPEITEEIFSDLRGQVVAKVVEEESNLKRKTQLLLEGEIFQANPYAHPVIGTVKTLENLYVRDLKIQQRRLMMPNQASLAVYYDGDREDLFRRLSRRWGVWVRKNAAPFTFRRAQAPESPKVLLIDSPEQQNGLLRLGFLAVEKSSRDYATLKVLEQYLTLSLPEWARRVSSANQIRGSVDMVARRMPGSIQISLEVPVDQLTAYYGELMGSISALLDGKVDTDRFEEAKRLVYQEYLSSFEDPLYRIRGLLETELYELGINFITTFGLRLERISPESFERGLNVLLPTERFVVVVAGPANDLQPFFQEIGEVQVLN